METKPVQKKATAKKPSPPIKRVEHGPGDLVKQANPITVARHDLSAAALKVFLLAYSKLTPEDEYFPRFEFSVGEVSRLVGDSQGHTVTLFSTLRKLQKESIEIDEAKESGTKIRKSHIPFPSIEVDEEAGTVTFTLNPNLQPFFLDLREQYTMFPVEDTFKLGTRYGIRLYVLVMQWAGKADKTGSWQVDLEVSAIRRMWGILPHEYREMPNFRRQVVERAITDINSAQLGLMLYPLPPKKNGRNITHLVVGVRRLDKKAPRKLNPEPVTQEEKENASRRKKYPEKWQEFRNFDLKQERLFSVDREAEAEGYADSELKKWATSQPKTAKKQAAKKVEK